MKEKTKIFRPKVDSWAIGLAFAIVLIGSIAVSIEVMALNEPYLIAANLVAMVSVNMIIIVFLWTTHYEITSQELVISMLFIKWRIKFEDIEYIEQGGMHALSASVITTRLRMAFSKDNLRIGVKNHLFKEAIVSPKEKREFIDLLENLRLARQIAGADNQSN